MEYHNGNWHGKWCATKCKSLMKKECAVQHMSKLNYWTHSEPCVIYEFTNFANPYESQVIDTFSLSRTSLVQEMYLIVCVALYNYWWKLHYVWRHLKRTRNFIIIWGSDSAEATAKPHDDVIKWKQFLRYWPFVRRIHRSLVNSPHEPVTQSFDVLFDLRLNERLSKRWFETPSRSFSHHCN